MTAAPDARNELGLPVVPGGDAVQPERTLDGILGFQVEVLHETTATGRFEVTDAVRQRFGIVHGGVYAAFAEMLASEATLAQADARTVRGVGNESKFFRGVADGSVTASAGLVHRGRSTWVWDVEFRPEDGELCATARVTVVTPKSPVP